MTKLYTKSDVAEIVRKGQPSFIRIFPNLYIDIKHPQIANWLFRYQISGERHQVIIGVYSETNSELMSYASAIQLTLNYQAMVANGDNPKLESTRKKYNHIQTVDDLATMYLARKADKIKTVHILERIYNKDIKPAIGQLTLDKVHPLDIYHLVQKVVQSGRPTVANQALYLCKNIFILGIKSQLVDNNPAANYTATEDGGGTQQPRDVVLEIEDIEILFEIFRKFPSKVPETTYIGFVLLLIMGVRKMELFSAKWQDVDFKRQYFHLYSNNTKTSKSLAVPLPDAVMPLFDQLKELSKGSEYIFPARKQSSRGYISDDTVNHTLADLFGKVVNNRKVSENVLEKAGVPSFTIHDLRRTFRTLLAELGISEEVAEKCLNHANTTIIQTYNRYGYKKERRHAHEKIAELILPMAGYSYFKSMTS